MDLSKYKKPPKSTYFGVYSSQAEYETAVEEMQDELKEAFYGVVTNGDSTVGDSYTYSTRTTNGDNLVKASYNSNDTLVAKYFIETVWGLTGWTWEDYTLNDVTYSGGHHTNYKTITKVKTVDDGYRLQHINDFIYNCTAVTEIEDFNHSNVVSANNAFRRKGSSNPAIALPASFNDWPALISGEHMFRSYTKGFTGSLGTFNAPNLKYGTYMFYRTSAGTLPFTSFNVPNLQSGNSMFGNCNLFTTDSSNVESGVVNVYLDSIFTSKFLHSNAFYNMFYIAALVNVASGSGSPIRLIVDLDTLFDDSVTDTIELDYINNIYESGSSTDNYLKIISHKHTFSLEGVLNYKYVQAIEMDAETLANCVYGTMATRAVSLNTVPFNSGANSTAATTYSSVTFTDSVPTSQRRYNFSTDGSIVDYGNTFAGCTVPSDFVFTNWDKCKEVNISKFVFGNTSTPFPSALFDSSIPVAERSITFDNYVAPSFSTGFEAYSTTTETWKVTDMSNLILHFEQTKSDTMGDNANTPNVGFTDYGDTGTYTNTPEIHLHYSLGAVGKARVYDRYNTITSIDVHNEGNDYLVINISCGSAYIEHITVTGNVWELDISKSANINISELEAVLLSQTSMPSHYTWYKRCLKLPYDVYYSLSSEAQTAATKYFTITLIQD